MWLFAVHRQGISNYLVIYTPENFSWIHECHRLHDAAQKREKLHVPREHLVPVIRDDWQDRTSSLQRQVAWHCQCSNFRRWLICSIFGRNNLLTCYLWVHKSWSSDVEDLRCDLYGGATCYEGSPGVIPKMTAIV